jgi:very-short-patch-repair endonuclease
VPDRRRWSALSVDEWTVIVVTHQDVKQRSDTVIEQLERALSRVQ